MSRSGEPWLHNEVAKRMAQRLPLIKHQPAHWVHWAPRLGGLGSQALLEEAYPQARVTVLEPQSQDLPWTQAQLQAPWWRFWSRPRDFGQTTSQAADMVWSNMGLHLQPRPADWMQQWAHRLNDQGFVMFSCLGPDSLGELREVYRQAGWPEPAHAFTDMHDWGDMLLQSGFASPIMDMERITLTYDSPQALLQELRTWGRNLHPARFPACRGRGWLAALHHAMQSQMASPQHGGRLALSLEVIYGHAFKAKRQIAVQSETQLSLADMKAMLQKAPST
jgi:malonyl-CoA O-methyltransferase